VTNRAVKAPAPCSALSRSRAEQARGTRSRGWHALAAVGLVQPTVLSARGGLAPVAATPPVSAATMMKGSIVAWFRIASRRATAGVSDKFKSAIKI
jgi:hypothetical protein